MPLLKTIVVDSRVLAGFKRRALKRYPHELYEVIMGRVGRETVYVYGFQDVEHGSDKQYVYTDPDSRFDEDQEFYPHKLIGSVHSHPDDSPDPSALDLKSAKEEGEIVFAICAITKVGKRRFVGWKFFDQTGRQLEVVISEG